MNPPAATRDPARQPERTRLSWRRTVLAATVVLLLAVRHALHQPTAVQALGVAAALGGWLVTVTVGWHRIRMLAAPRPGPARWYPTAIALIVAGYGALGVTLVLVPA